MARETLLNTLPYLRHCVQSQANHPPYRLAYADSLLNLGRLAAATENWSEAAVRFAECAPLLGERPADQFVAAEGLAIALERLGPGADDSDELRLRNAWGEQLRTALSSLARHSEFGPRIERDPRWKPWR